MGEKSLLVTYLLWLCFGWLGIHHVYLGRDRQAFAWWSTAGGFFGLGWARDFWRIPDYVEDANEDVDYMRNLHNKMKYRKQPQFNTSRFSGQVLIGSFYGTLVRLAFPDGSPGWIIAIGVSLGIACGVHLIGNVGREKGQLLMPYLATLFAYIALYLMSREEPGYVNCAIISALAFNYYREWRKPKPSNTEDKKTVCERASKFTAGIVIVLALWSSFFCFNATITYQNGEKIQLTDSMVHFFKSPVWMDFRSTFWTLYSQQGEEANKEWSHFYQDIVHSFDPTGERNARAVLGVDEENASEETIRRRYKKLIFQWHPDRYKGKDNEMAQKRFIEIQQAYELLQKRMVKRKSTRRRPTTTNNESQADDTRTKTEF